ncbi:hypothetical protein ABG768_011758, partial [Culter alburnus]
CHFFPGNVNPSAAGRRRFTCTENEIGLKNKNKSKRAVQRKERGRTGSGRESGPR